VAQPIGNPPQTVSWSGHGVGLDTVAEQLHRLSRPGPTACCVNVLVGLGSDTDPQPVSSLLTALAPGHPLRAVLVVDRGEVSGIDAEVVCERSPRGPIQRQQVLLRVSSRAGRRLPSLAARLLAAEVPTYLWWPGGGPSLDLDETRRDVDTCDALIVDSALRDDHPALVAAGERGRASVADLLWPRLRPWRESLATFFAPPGRRAYLAGVERLELETGPHPEGTRAAALLLGWMAARLDQRLDAAWTEGDRISARYRHGGGRVLVRILPGESTGELRALSLRARDFELTLRHDDGDRARLRFRIDGTVDQHLFWRPPAPGDQLGELLTDARRDSVYAGALAQAAMLLQALR
jgi:hypothetical protein